MLRSIIAIAVFVACANALHISRHQSSDLAQEARQKGSALAPADHRFLVVQATTTAAPATTAAPNTTLVAPLSVSTQAVCVEMVIPLVGEWVLLDLGAGLSLTNKSDGTVILEGFLAVGVSLDLVLVTLQIGIKGTLAINLQLPASVPAEPLAITQWAIKTIIHGMIEKSKFASSLLNSPKKSYYIDQVQAGVQKAADLVSGTPVSNQVLSDTFAEMFHNYVNTMQYHCPHKAGIYKSKSYCQASTTVSSGSTTTIYAQDNGFEEVGSGDEYPIPKHCILGGNHWIMGGVSGPPQCQNTAYTYWANEFENDVGHRYCNYPIWFDSIVYSADCGVMTVPEDDPRRRDGDDDGPAPNGGTKCSCQGTARSTSKFTNGVASGVSSCNKPTATDWAWMIPTLEAAIEVCGKAGPTSGTVGGVNGGQCYAFSWNPDSWSYFYGQGNLGKSTFDVQTHTARNNPENYAGGYVGRGWTSYVRMKQFSQMDTDSRYKVLGGTRITSMQIKSTTGAPYWPSGISLTKAETLCGDEESCVAFSWNSQDATVFYSDLTGKMATFADMTTSGSAGNGKGDTWHDGSSNPPGWTNYNSAKGEKSTKDAGLGDFWAVSADARIFAIAKAGIIAESTDSTNADYLQPACDITTTDCLKAFQNFLLSHFSLNFFGKTFNFNGGSWADTPALDCDTDLDPSYYFNTLRVNRINHPGVTLESVTQAGIRLCHFIASGVLLPDPKDQDSTLDYDKHKDSNMLNMLMILMPSLFPGHQDNSIFVTNTVFQDRESIGEHIKSLGKGGGTLSTFHHMMAILSGTPDQVGKQLTKYAKAQAKKKADGKKQSCGAGIKSVTGAVAVTVSVGAKSGGGFCASTAPEISVGAVVSASLVASQTKPCALSKWSKATAAFTFKVQLPTIKVPFTKMSMSIGVSGFIGLNGDSVFSLKFLELIPKAKEEEKPATPKPEESPLVAALKAGFATAKPEIQPLIQTIADVADYHNSQQKTKGDLVSLLMTDLLSVAYTVLSTYVDAKITEEGKKLGCTGKVCKAGEAKLKGGANAALKTAMAGKNLVTTGEAAMAAEKKAIIHKLTNFTSEENAVKAKYENFKSQFTVASFKKKIKAEGDSLVDQLVAKIAAAALKKAEKTELPGVPEVIELSYKGVQFEMINAKTFNINYIEWATQGIEIQAEGSSGAAFESQVSSTNVLTLGL